MDGDLAGGWEDSKCSWLCHASLGLGATSPDAQESRCGASREGGEVLGWTALDPSLDAGDGLDGAVLGRCGGLNLTSGLTGKNSVSASNMLEDSSASTHQTHIIRALKRRDHHDT